MMVLGYALKSPRGLDFKFTRLSISANFVLRKYPSFWALVVFPPVFWDIIDILYWDTWCKGRNVGTASTKVLGPGWGMELLN